jgi:hypothetical protein
MSRSIALRILSSNRRFHAAGLGSMAEQGLATASEVLILQKYFSDDYQQVVAATAVIADRIYDVELTGADDIRPHVGVNATPLASLLSSYAGLTADEALTLQAYFSLDFTNLRSVVKLTLDRITERVLDRTVQGRLERLTPTPVGLEAPNA